MSSSVPPVIAFELGVGEFRIVTPEAVYQIKVLRDLVNASGQDEPDLPPTAADKADDAPRAAAQVPAVSEADDDNSAFFKEISEELFDKIGRLARRLSVSVEELPSHLDIPDFDQTDQQLESAKGQLEEVVKLTEKASMTIMDTADQIQVDMDQLQNQLGILNKLDLMTAPEDGQAGQAVTPATAADPAFFQKMNELKALIASWLPAGAPTQEPEEKSAETPAEAVEAPEAEAAEAPAPAEPATTTVISFEVDVVFQTLYELCTNESVKDHIKAMREVQTTDFDSKAVADQLAELAPTVDEEDGFYNFPIPDVLKTLYAATASEDFRATLKKMNQTAAGIFLDTVLPIEGQKQEVTVPVEAPAAEAEAAEAEEPPMPVEEAPAEETSADETAEAAVPVADLRVLQNLAGELEALAHSGFTPAEGGSAAAGTPAALYTPILTQDRDTIIQTVGSANDLIQKTGRHLTRILETLAFQDLSGQRIMRVVTLIGDIQTQLITILVSANTKLKAHQDSGLEDAGGEAEKMAQQEVDKAMEKLSGGSALKGPGAETRLDQGAVNDLLAQLGF